MHVNNETEDPRDYLLSRYFPKGIKVEGDYKILPLPDKSIVLNQYTTPTCVGQACAMAKMITEYMLTNKWVALSPYSIYGYYDNDGGGMSVRYGVEVLYKWGCLPLSEFSHVGDNPELHRKLAKHRRENPGAEDSAARYKIDSYAKICNFDEVKQAIYAGMPVVGAVKTQASFGKLNGGIEPKYPQGVTGRHAICFVGYAHFNEEDYLIAINSWGERNGTNGFVYIPKGRYMDSLFCISDTITPIKYKCKELRFVIGSSKYRADGEVKTFDTAPYIKDDRTYLPVRFVAENLGASVEWDANTSTATIRSEEATIQLTEGSTEMHIGDLVYHMDVAPEIRDNRLMCPIRFIAEILGAKVDWNPLNKMVTIEAL